MATGPSRAGDSWEGAGRGGVCVNNSWRVCFGHGAVSVLPYRPGPAVGLGLREAEFGSCV